MTILTRAANEGEKKWYEKNGIYWECGVSQFDYTYDHDETCIVCTGLAEIACDGKTVRLEPGVLAVFPKGAVTHWNVIQPVTKYFR